MQIENIEEMQRRAGIADVERHEGIGQLMPSDSAKISFMIGPAAFEALQAWITSIRGGSFRGNLASQPLAKGLPRFRLRSPLAFGADHIHSIC